MATPITGRVAALVAEPRVVLAAKTGTAAAVAWFVGNLVPWWSLDDYAYYAALGAFTVMQPAVADSIKEAARVEVAMVVGVGLAGLVDWIAWPNVVTVGLVVGIGMLIAGVSWFGDQSAWVPLAAMYALIFTAMTGPTFAVAMIVQVLLGAVVGLAVNTVLLPPLGLSSMSRANDHLQRILVRQLRDVSDALTSGSVDDAGLPGTTSLEQARRQAHDRASEARRASVGNPRARRWADTRSHGVRRTRALQHVADLVQDVGAVLAEFQDDRYEVLSESRRADAARMFDDLAELLDDPTHEHADAADTSIRRVGETVEQGEFEHPQERYLAGMIAVSARRCLSTISDISLDQARDGES